MQMRLFNGYLTVFTGWDEIVTINVVFGQAATVVFRFVRIFKRLRLRTRARRVEGLFFFTNFRLLDCFSHSLVISGVDRR